MIATIFPVCESQHVEQLAAAAPRFDGAYESRIDLSVLLVEHAASISTAHLALISAEAGRVRNADWSRSGRNATG